MKLLIDTQTSLNLAKAQLRVAIEQPGIAYYELAQQIKVLEARLQAETTAEHVKAANAPHIGHFYTPIKAFDGRVLKYQGIASESNKEWFIEQNPGTIILPERIADRIWANDHTDYNI